MPGPRRFLLATAMLAGVVGMTGCLFGGGDDLPAIPRAGSVVTATPPANLPEPILLGESQATGTGGTPVPAGQVLYTVRSGDSLSAIASQLGIPAGQQAAWIAEVLRINGIPDPTLLRAGQEILVPQAQATPRPTGTPQQATAATPTQAAAAATPTPGAAAQTTPVQGSGRTYTVVSGDSPVAIAAKLGVPLAEQDAWAQQLMALNNITCAACLQVGQVLQLPANTPQQPAATNTPAATATNTPAP